MKAYISKLLSKINLKMHKDWKCPKYKVEHVDEYGVEYGNCMHGFLKYDRFKEEKGENGFVLSAETWQSHEIMRKELYELTHRETNLKKVTILTDDTIFGEELNFSLFCGSETWKDEEQELHLMEMPAKSLKNMVIYWVNYYAMKKGGASPELIRQIKSLLEIDAEDNNLNALLASIKDEVLKHTPDAHLFPELISVRHIGSDRGDIYIVDGTEIEKVLAYAYLLEKCNGVIYAVNMELVSSDDVTLFTPKKDCVYTYAASELDKFYQSQSMNVLFNDSDFYFMGIHSDLEKQELLNILEKKGISLSEKEENWISEPNGGGVVIIPKLGTYILGQIL